MTTAGVVGFLACWFCPFYDSDKFEDSNYYGGPNDKFYSIFSDGHKISYSVIYPRYEYWRVPQGIGLKMRDFNGKFMKIGKWTYNTTDKSGKFEGRYKFGKKDGIWIFYHRNGQKAVQIEYVNGSPTYNWTRWYDDGQIKDKEEPLTDKETYQYVSWNRNGIKTMEGNFKLVAWQKVSHLKLVWVAWIGEGLQTSHIPCEIYRWRYWKNNGTLNKVVVFDDKGSLTEIIEYPPYQKQLNELMRVPSIAEQNNIVKKIQINDSLLSEWLPPYIGEN
jgi:antitoxin component YwqK of YwqJK toxin-antitoxin module